MCAENVYALLMERLKAAYGVSSFTVSYVDEEQDVCTIARYFLTTTSAFLHNRTCCFPDLMCIPVYAIHRESELREGLRQAKGTLKLFVRYPLSPSCADSVLTKNCCVCVHQFPRLEAVALNPGD